MEFLKFLFSNFWHFIGIIVLIIVVFEGIVVVLEGIGDIIKAFRDKK